MSKYVLLLSICLLTLIGTRAKKLSFDESSLHFGAVTNISDKTYRVRERLCVMKLDLNNLTWCQTCWKINLRSDLVYI